GSTPFPYTTLFRSRPAKRQVLVEGDEIDPGEPISDGMADLSFTDSDDDEDTGITVSDDGSLDLSAFLGGDGGDSDDGPGLDFGDADDDGPELVFGDDEPAVDDDPFASVDESADEPDEEGMPEFDFDADIAAEDAGNGEAEP